MGIFPHPVMALVVRVSLRERSYPIWIGSGVLGGVSAALAGKRGVWVTDRNVWRAQKERLMPFLQEGWRRLILRPGEGSKSVGVWSEVLERLAAWHLDRDGVLVAAGGGVVGDVTGFAAAAYLRGIRFVQIPTSLLAMTDSAVGGKTGINLQGGKNLAGAFWQPMAVFADTDVLGTLPEREFRGGLAEVVKCGVGLDGSFLTWLERNADEIRAREPKALERMVARCCRLKAAVVEKDEQERSGVRSALNLGHTLGHALEKVSGFRMSHGEGVAAGLCWAVGLSMEMRGFSLREGERVVRLLWRFGLRPDRLVPRGVEAGAVWEAMKGDKKNAGGEVRVVLCDGPGHALPPEALPARILKESLRRFLGRSGTEVRYGVGE